MPITYTIDHDEKLITEVWIAEDQANDLAAHRRVYLADPDVMAIRRTVVDLRQAEDDLDALRQWRRGLRTSRRTEPASRVSEDGSGTKVRSST